MALQASPRDRFRRYSFSGSDAEVYAYFPGAGDLLSRIQTVHTLSISVHEAKGDVRALGHRNVRGRTRGIRTVAGTMILTVVNDHPLRDLMVNGLAYEQRRGEVGWSVDYYRDGVGSALDQFNYKNRVATMIPPFNLLVRYVSEGGDYDLSVVSTGGDETASEFQLNYEGASWLIEGIDIVDVGMVTSVHDIVTEVTVSFKACDYRPLSRNEFSSVFTVPQSGHRAETEQLFERLGMGLSQVASGSEIWGTDSEGGSSVPIGTAQGAPTNRLVPVGGTQDIWGNK